MKQKIFAICDMEEAYALRMAEYMLEKIRLPYALHLFTKVEELEKFIVDNQVQIAALTIPKTKAPEIADRLVAAGIKAIWNFAHTDLVVPEDVVVENVHLSESLMRLSYRVCSMQDQQEKLKGEEK